MPFDDLRRVVLEFGAFEALVRDLAWPALTETLAGEHTWRNWLDQATPGDREAMLHRLSAELTLAEPGALRRYDAWCLAGRPHADADWLDAALWVHGDSTMLSVIGEALARVPPYVRWAVAGGTLFIAVDGTRAWASRTPAVDDKGLFREATIVLGPGTDVALVAHECAHVWLSPWLPPDTEPSGDRSAVPADGEVALRQLAERDGWGPRLADWEARSERLADALALAWLLDSERTWRRGHAEMTH